MDNCSVVSQLISVQLGKTALSAHSTSAFPLNSVQLISVSKCVYLSALWIAQYDVDRI